MLVNRKFFFPGLSIIMFTLFCDVNTPAESAPHVQKIRIINKKAVSEPFHLFLKKFNADPGFQLSRVKFPFKVTEYPEEGEKPTPPRFIAKNEWKQVKLQQKDKMIIRKEVTGKTSITVQLMLDDTGVLVNHYFKCIKGEWWLVEIQDASD